MSAPDHVSDSSPSVAISPYETPTGEVQSVAIRTAALKLIDIINEQCAIATSRERAEKQQALDALTNLQREHFNFKNNVALINTEYRKQAATLQAERDNALAQRDQLMKAKDTATDGLRKMKERIEMYNGEFAGRGVDFRFQIPDSSVAPEKHIEPQGCSKLPSSPDVETELVLLRKRCNDLQKQNVLLVLQVSTAESQRAASEDSYERNIAELEQRIAELSSRM